MEQLKNFSNFSNKLKINEDIIDEKKSMEHNDIRKFYETVLLRIWVAKNAILAKKSRTDYQNMILV